MQSLLLTVTPLQELTAKHAADIPIGLLSKYGQYLTKSILNGFLQQLRKANGATLPVPLLVYSTNQEILFG